MSPMQRHIARSGAQRKPWLTSKEWRERRIVVSHGMRGFFFALALIFIGPMAILGFAGGIWALVEGHPAEGVGGLFFGAMIAGFLAGFRYSWLAWRKFGKTICHLETLPGVIGGWFKASVEVTLPVETHPAVLVRVVNRNERTTVWEISERVFPAQLTRIQGDRFLVPVRFHIPARKDYYAKTPWNALTGRGSWWLHITAERPGGDLAEVIRVPIFETGEAPPEEQTPEWGLWTVEVVHANAKFRFFQLFHNESPERKLIAKAGREKTFSGRGRKGETDVGWYFQTEAEAQECADKFRGDPTLRVRVYDEKHE